MIQLSPELNNARLLAVVDFLALGTTNGSVSLYEGPRPALGGTPPAEPLATIPLVEPVGTVSAGVLTLTAAPEVMVLRTGVAAWARFVNGDGALAFDCDVSDMAGSGEIKLPDTVMYAGGYTRLVAGTLG